jgi:CheY-like chemotaxis protein
MARPINVLAVDDTPANLVTLEAVLGDSCNVVCAQSGPEAIAILEARHDIDVIVLDVQMPLLDGFETATRIKQMDSARHIPIVFLTAVYRDDPWVHKGYEVGAIDYFSKPYDPELLRLKIGIYGSLNLRAEMLRERERQLQAAQDLAAAAGKLSSALERGEAGMIVADLNGGVRRMNDEVLRIFRPAKPAGSEAHDEAGVLEGSKRFICDQLGSVLQAPRDGRAGRREVVRIRCGDGSEKSILCLVSVLRDMDSVPAGIAVVIHDLTQFERMEHDFELRIAELRAAGK